jgi:hypothetical protein
MVSSAVGTESGESAAAPALVTMMRRAVRGATAPARSRGYRGPWTGRCVIVALTHRRARAADSPLNSCSNPPPARTRHHHTRQCRRNRPLRHCAHFRRTHLDVAGWGNRPSIVPCHRTNLQRRCRRRDLLHTGNKCRAWCRHNKSSRRLEDNIGRSLRTSSTGHQHLHRQCYRRRRYPHPGSLRYSFQASCGCTRSETRYTSRQADRILGTSNSALRPTGTRASPSLSAC